MSIQESFTRACGAAGLLLGALFHVCCHAAPSGDAGVVAIGIAVPLSGSSEEYGRSLMAASQLAIDEANEKGLAIQGKPVRLELLPANDRSNAYSAALAAEYLVKKKVVGVVGHGSTATSLMAAPIYDKAGIAMITPSASNKTLTDMNYRTVFRTIGHDNAAAVYAAQYVVQELKILRVAIVDNGTKFGMGLGDQFERSMTRQGGRVVVRRSVNDKTSDFNHVLQDLQGQQMDLVFFAGLYKQAAELLRNMRRTGNKARFMTGSNGAAEDAFLSLAGPAAEGAISIETGMPKEKMNGWKRFRENYGKINGPKIDAYAPYAYDATQALVAALRLADSTNAAKVAEALRKVRFRGLSGTISFDDHGDLTEPTFTIYTVERQRWAISRLINDHR